VNAGVGQKVRHHLVKALGIPLDHHSLFHALSAPVVVRACYICIGEGVPDNLGEINGFLLKLTAFVQAREQKKVFHERGHSNRFRLDAI
jgi:hypothetical protein